MNDFDENDVFIGREKELSILQTANKKLQLGKQIPVINYYGLPGLGKTTYLKKLVDKSHKIFPGVLIESKFAPNEPDHFIKYFCDILHSKYNWTFPIMGIILARIAELQFVENKALPQHYCLDGGILPSDNNEFATYFKNFISNHLGADWERIFFGLNYRELVNLLPAAFALDIDHLLNEASLRGLVLAIDDLDSNPLILTMWVLDIVKYSRKILLVVSTDFKIEPKEHVEFAHFEFRKFERGDFYKFLRKKGLNIDSVNNPPNIDNTTLLIPFWTNLFAEVMLRGYFPESGFSLDKDALSEIFLKSLDAQQKAVSAVLLLLGITTESYLKDLTGIEDIQSLEPILIRKGKLIRIHDAFRGQILELIRSDEEIMAAINKIELLNTIDSPLLALIQNITNNSAEIIDYLNTGLMLENPICITKISNLFSIIRIIHPQNFIFVDIIYKYLRLFYPPKRMKEYFEKNINNTSAVLSVLAQFGLLRSYIDLKELRTAKDLYETSVSYLSEIKTRNGETKESRYLTATLQTFIVEILRLMEKENDMLSEIDELKLYINRVSGDLDAEMKMTLFDSSLQYELYKISYLISNKSTSLYKALEDIIAYISTRNTLLTDVFAIEVFKASANFHTEDNDFSLAIDFIKKARTRMKTFFGKMKNRDFKSREKFMFINNRLLEFCEILNNTNEYFFEEELLRHIISNFETIPRAHLEKDPALLFLLGKANYLHGSLQYTMSNYSEAARSLSLAIGLFSRYDEFSPFEIEHSETLSDLYYVSGRNSEMQRDYPYAFELFEKAENHIRKVLKNKQTEENTLFSLGMILTRKARAAKVLDKAEAHSASIKEAISIFEILQNTESSQRGEILFNLGQTQLFMATTLEMGLHDSINQLTRAMHNIEQASSYGISHAMNLIEKIGSISLTMYNKAIESEDYHNGFYATVLSGQAALKCQSPDLIYAVKQLLNQWEQFPLPDEFFQMMKDLEYQLEQIS